MAERSGSRRPLVAASLAVAVLLTGCTSRDEGSTREDASATTTGTESVAESADRSDALLERTLPADEPGCSAAVGIEGEVAWTGARGLADLSTSRPIETSTTFALGSVSKQFTATVLLLLAHDDRLSLDDPLSTWLPDLPPWGSQVPLRQAMHHVSGIPDYVDLRLESGVPWTEPRTVDDSRTEIGAIAELDFPPGDRPDYSNSNYFLLADVVRAVTGRPLQDVVRELLLEPLGLALQYDDAGWNPDTTDPSSARGYVRDPVSGEWALGGIRWETHGDAGIQATPSELVRWADNYRTGRVGGSRLLADALPEAGAGRYGAGIIEEDDGSLGHSGSAPGHLADFYVSPDRRTGIAVACNGDRGSQSTIRPLAVALRQEWGR
jgi:CubicO group peptidase (beta-lactamase class C family)